MSVCTLQQVKTRLDTTSDSSDDMLEQIITGVAAAFDNYCDRCLVKPSEPQTQYFSCNCDNNYQVLYLRYFPVISVAGVREALYHRHDSAADLTADIDYMLNSDRGVLTRIGYSWLQGLDTVRVVYTGGYTPAGQTPGDGELAMPDNIVEAAIRQTLYLYQRNSELGLKSVASSQGSISTYGDDGLLRGVRDLLNPYRRVFL